MSAPPPLSILDSHVVALDTALTRLEEAERRLRAAEAARLEALAEVFDVAAAANGPAHSSVPSGRSGEILYRTVRAEAAAVLRQNEQTVERLFSQAQALAFSYPGAFDALRAAAISERHAAVIVDAGAVIGSAEDPDAVLRRAAYESAVLEHALLETPSRLRPIARRIAEQYAQQPLDERHREARKRRRVSLQDGDDGMSDLIAHLPAVAAHGIYRMLTDRSREIERAGEGASRTRDEIRADLLAGALLDGAHSDSAASGASRQAGARGARAQVQIVIPVERIAPSGTGAPDRAPAPADDGLGCPTAAPSPALTGYGPIDGDTAREVAALADFWDLVRVDSGTGAVRSVDRYRPSGQMRRYLAARDQHCRFPGCRAPLARCDIDHTIDAALGGPTATDNLAHLCRGHHTLKHHGGWRVQQGRDGTLEWRSPTGRGYRERSPSRVAFVRGGDPAGARTTGSRASPGVGDPRRSGKIYADRI